MKIGICTFHFAHNYGAMLQAYSLKHYLECLGNEVYMTCNRRYTLTKWNPKSFWKENWKGKLLYVKYLVKWYLPKYYYLHVREKHFEQFRERYLDDKIRGVDTYYDAIVYGSDQIWSKFESGYDKVFWGVEQSNTKKRIAFSASMGVVRIENEEDRSFLKHALSRFSAVSVREKDLQDALIDLKLAPQLTIERTIDPAFLLSVSEWSQLAKKRLVKESYLLFYDFQTDKQTTEMVRMIAKEKSLRVIRMTDGIVSLEKDENCFRCAGPLDYLSLFKYADFVVSSSFHGTAFSIIFEKQFLVRQIWNKERVKTMLATFGLADRFVEQFDRMPSRIPVIDYSAVNPLVEKEVAEAKNYLLRSLTYWVKDSEK